jgi:cytochrome c oxidase assembly protein subunit 15
MSGICTVLIVALAVWVFSATRSGDRARKSAIASVFFLVTEALLGAALVLGGWVEHNISTARVIMQSIHFTNTMLLLAAVGVTAWWISQREHRDSETHAVGSFMWPAWIAAISTIVVGATGAVAALADTLFPSPSLREAFAADFAASAPLLVRMRWIHPASAVVGFCCVLWLALRVRSKLSRTVIALLALQILLGIVDVLTLAPTWMQIVHLLVADLYWIALVALVADTIWPASRKTLHAT